MKIKQMNPEIKAKWVQALKSGKYNQADGFLRVDDNYCCLGVLCDIYHRETGLGEWSEISFPSVFAFAQESKIESSKVLLPKVMEWAGLESCNPLIDKETSLAMLNDDHLPFECIADIINEKF